jgi:radical SAM superfamily enzyme YgiQ (UPF0313 family)
MRISIISVNQEWMPHPVMPIGAACVAACLREQGHEVQILDLCYVKKADEAIASHLKSYQPVLIGVSVRNLENDELFHHRSFLGYIRDIVDVISSQEAKIVIGGSGFTLFSKELLRYLEVPYGLSGDGECSLPQFVKSVAGGGDLGFIPGICYWDGEVVAKPPAEVEDFTGLPFPAYDLIDHHRYALDGASYPIEGRRGCDSTCSFCVEGAKGKGSRLKPPKLVVDEMEFMSAECNARRFHFVDGLFNIPSLQAMAMCQEIIVRNLKVSWTAAVNPIGLSQGLLHEMKQAGCVGVSLGIDTASERMLKSYSKGFEKGDIAQAIALLNKVKLPYSIFILFGGPGETKETIAETIDFLQGVSQPIFIRFGIRIFKGTELERQARQEGVLKDDQNMLLPTYYLSREFEPAIMDRVDEYCESRQNWFALAKKVKLGMV